MIPNPKPANASPEVADVVDSTAASFATLMHRGIERLANLQTKVLDLVGWQTADINVTMRQLRQSINSPDFSGGSFLDFTGQAVEGWIAAQKNVLDRMVEQSADAVEASTRCGHNATNSLASLREFAQKAVAHAVETQMAMLDFAVKQNEAVSEVIQKQANGAGTLVAEAAQSLESGMATLIDANREFLDTASQLTNSAGRA
jgi:hypothetical protein